MVTDAPETEAELEAFRQQWREEVTARNSRAGGQTGLANDTRQPHVETGERTSSKSNAGPSTARRKDATDYSEDLEPRAYHDLPDQEEQLRLGQDGQNHDRDVHHEPASALEHYERAVEKETQGQLGDSMRHYRKAFKLDDGVHEAYKKKHFPPSFFAKHKLVTHSLPSTTVIGSETDPSLPPRDSPSIPLTLKQMIDDFSSLRIEAAAPPSDASPQVPSPFAELPEEILSQILDEVATVDVASFARLSRVCKHLAYLVMTEEPIWKRIALGESFGFEAMLYDYGCSLDGKPLVVNDNVVNISNVLSDEGEEIALLPTTDQQRMAFSTLTESLLHSTYASSYRTLFRSRPRVRFNGCYISTVNYTRAGGNNTNTLTWGAPIHVVTYFRYLRFFRDGTCISLLTTSEPVDVVHHLTKDNLVHVPAHTTSLLPNSVMKDALRGRWRLSGPASSSFPSTETEGDLHVETVGATPKYTYRMLLALAHAGKVVKNNKLAWKGFWSYNRLTDDWGEFGLRNDRAFYWSRVGSYGMGYNR